MFENAKWITHPNNILHEPSCFVKKFNINNYKKTRQICIKSVNYSSINELYLIKNIKYSFIILGG